MMLSKESCEACRADAKTVSDEERDYLLTKTPQWSIETRAGIPQLERLFTFNNFVDALT
mgnify:CR=1 FL=1